MGRPAPSHVRALVDRLAAVVDGPAPRPQARHIARRFNTAGPNTPADHYTLPVLRRLPMVRTLVDDKAYFVLHAPRQAGKTTALSALARELTSEQTYAAVFVSVEMGAAFRQDVGAAELAVLESWRGDAELQLPPQLQPPPWPDAPPGSRIHAALRTWARHSARPLVTFIDEIDALQGDVLVSVLRQLRDGYRKRPAGFPWSLALIGLRDVRDYKLSAAAGDTLKSASPFNIKAESLTLRNFTAEEVVELCGQHTAETGQPFEPNALEQIFELTRGQPWLVNALGRQLVQVIAPEPNQSITAEHVEQAKAILIERQDTHLDSLMERLREPRVKAIVEPMLAGESLADVPNDDIRFAIDLGLLRDTEHGGIDVANPIYRQVIAQSLSYSRKASLPHIQPSWLRADGSLDAERLLEAFLSFWRRHGEPLMRGAPYHEVAPHLVLMAFLDRVANGGGRVEREYAIGRGRMDLCLHHGTQRLAIEIKVRKPGQADPLAEGLRQLDGYLAGLGLDRGWLIIFDRREGLPPLAERLSVEQALTPGEREITVLRS